MGWRGAVALTNPTSNWTDEAYDLLDGLLTPDITTRLTADDALKSSFLNK